MGPYRKGLISVLLLLGAVAARAETPAAANPLANESELGIVASSGNSDAQTFSVKQLSVYTWDANILKGFGRYLLGKTGGITSAESGELGARYERNFGDTLAGFGQYRLDKNGFAGLDLRHTLDAGAKYYFLKEEKQQLFNETGYRYTSEHRLLPTATVASHFVRLYFEYNTQFSEAVGAKLGLELLPNLSTSADYQANLEAAVTATMSSLFSMKVGYLGQYRNQPATAGKKRLDSLFTTSLVAKF